MKTALKISVILALIILIQGKCLIRGAPECNKGKETVPSNSNVDENDKLSVIQTSPIIPLPENPAIPPLDPLSSNLNITPEHPTWPPIHPPLPTNWKPPTPHPHTESSTTQASTTKPPGLGWDATTQPSSTTIPSPTTTSTTPIPTTTPTALGWEATTQPSSTTTTTTTTQTPTTKPPGWGWEATTQIPTSPPIVTQLHTTQPATTLPTTQPVTTMAPTTKPPGYGWEATTQSTTSIPTTQPLTTIPTTQPTSPIPTTQLPTTKPPGGGWAATTLPPATLPPTTLIPTTQSPPTTQQPTTVGWSSPTPSSTVATTAAPTPAPCKVQEPERPPKDSYQLTKWLANLIDRHLRNVPQLTAYQINKIKKNFAHSVHSELAKTKDSAVNIFVSYSTDN